MYTENPEWTQLIIKFLRFSYVEIYVVLAPNLYVYQLCLLARLYDLI